MSIYCLHIPAMIQSNSGNCCSEQKFSVGFISKKTMIEQVFREVEQMLAIEESAGYQRIFEKGLEQGIEKAKRDTARQMKAKGLTPELIAEVTGLSLSEVQAL